jgi:hypothetical protein
MNVEKLKSAADLVRRHTGGSCNLSDLAGPRNVDRRREIMSALAGTRVPVSACGVTALRSTLHAVAEIKGTCAADADAKFATWCARA